MSYLLQELNNEANSLVYEDLIAFEAFPEFQVVPEDNNDPLIRRVGKLCVFKTITTSRIDETKPLSQGSAISLSENNELIVTARHLLTNFDPNTHKVFVSFEPKPCLPKWVSMEDAHWICYTVYDRESTPNANITCTSCGSLLSDFIFLARRGDSNVRLRIGDHLSTGYIHNTGKCCTVGFFCSDDMRTDVDIQRNFARDINKEMCRYIMGMFKERGLYQKTICYAGNHILSCEHVVRCKCLCCTGLSGGMVIQNHDVSVFSAMHVGRDMSNQALGLLHTHLLNGRSWTP